MSKRFAKNAIRQIAKREGISVEAVKKEMQNAIIAAYNNPKTKAVWNERFGEGVLPTPEEFISKMSQAIA